MTQTIQFQSEIPKAEADRALAEFQSHGYCRVKVFDEADVQAMERLCDRFLAESRAVFEGAGGQGPVDPAKVDKARQQVRILHPHRHEPEALAWFVDGRVAAWLAVLLGRPALGAQTMIYFKPPGGRGQGMHQDNFYLLAKPATCIGAWTAIDAADEANGCLWVVPGSHGNGILCPDQGKDHWLSYGDSHITRFPRDKKAEPVPVPRGETLFFSGDLIHGSGPNRTADRWRRTFIGHYVDEATDTLARFYHPVLNMAGDVVSQVAVHAGGGPCGDGWEGAVH